jgi:hypothetical protein
VKLAKTTVKYASALNLAQKAQEQNGGYSVMTSQAKKLVKQLKAVKDNYDSEIKPLLNKAAKAMEDGDYDSAVSTYSSILDLPYINGLTTPRSGLTSRTCSRKPRASRKTPAPVLKAPAHPPQTLPASPAARNPVPTHLLPLPAQPALPATRLKGPGPATMTRSAAAP